ncbi:hypothetical protein CUJ83_15030 [Methanocella sp. CWC-04]|uniref:Uncharacterized protein n=2 Tax=Methanooceanicella nereidis TaxID=2052831 RepID=A0AAP2RGP9_9EURY|nr:hypothetical protein [Methanocella sp. CWC-04]
MYLSGQNNFVSAEDILSDRLSGFTSGDELLPVLRQLCLLLEVRTIPDGISLYRLPYNLDGYRSIFKIIKDRSPDIYNFLYSNYSHSAVNESFIKEALGRAIKTSHFQDIAGKYQGTTKPGEALILLLSQSPGFRSLVSMFQASPSVAERLLFPENLSMYELTHLKITLDLAFASDMLKRVPPGTRVSIKYEVLSKGTVDVETRGGTEVP